MRRATRLKLISIVVLTLAVAACDTRSQLGLLPENDAISQYKINFQLPSNWRMVSSAKDPGGYFEYYRPEDSANANPAIQVIQINFGLNNKTSLKDSMQQVLQAHNSYGCKSVNSKLLSQQENSITFTSSLAQCPNGIEMKSIEKIFATSDGHYSIVYSANPQVVPAATMRRMYQVVQQAQIMHKHGA